jgi:hypothetical protein
MSIGIRGIVFPVGGENELAAYTTVLVGLSPFTKTLNRLL